MRKAPHLGSDSQWPSLYTMISTIAQREKRLRRRFLSLSQPSPQYRAVFAQTHSFTIMRKAQQAMQRCRSNQFVNETAVLAHKLTNHHQRGECYNGGGHKSLSCCLWAGISEVPIGVLIQKIIVMRFLLLLPSQYEELVVSYFSSWLCTPQSSNNVVP